MVIKPWLSYYAYYYVSAHNNLCSMSAYNNTLGHNPKEERALDIIFQVLVACVIAAVIAVLYVLWEVVIYPQ